MNNLLRRIPEHLRGWAYLILTILFVAILATIFVVEVLEGGDLASWITIALGALGLGGSGLAQANTSRRKQ